MPPESGRQVMLVGASVTHSRCSNGACLKQRPNFCRPADSRTLKVFIAATSLREECGGPAYSVARPADALSNLGLEIGLWVADASWPASLERTVVRRLRGTEIDALEPFGRPDIVHDNGIWRAHNQSLARLCDQRRVARVVSTRGMLEPWAIRHKRVKKTIARQLYQRADLRAASVHHATSRNEADNISQLSLGVPVRVVPNGVDAPDVLLPSQKDGRIYPVRGLPMLVEAWARVRPLGWRLVIAGLDENGHDARDRTYNRRPAGGR